MQNQICNNITLQVEYGLKHITYLCTCCKNDLKTLALD